MSKIISTRNVSIKYSDKIVLNDISIAVEKGEIFGLLGPSGAGKTTLIRILTNQEAKFSGSVNVLGCDVGKWKSSINTRLGIMADGFGMYERLTCYENLKLYADLYEVASFEIELLLEKVGLSDARDKLANRLSKGMLQRLSLAKAVLHSPELLFLDEPTSDLDPHTTMRIHKLIGEMKDEGTTVFLTTHNMDEATKLCDHVGLLSEGQIIEYGVPAELCIKYNLENSIIITDKNNEVTVLPNNSDSVEQIALFFAQNNVKRIRSSEPNLEKLFIQLTGRGLGNNNDI